MLATFKLTKKRTRRRVHADRFNKEGSRNKFCCPKVLINNKFIEVVLMSLSLDSSQNFLIWSLKKMARVGFECSTTKEETRNISGLHSSKPKGKQEYPWMNYSLLETSSLRCKGKKKRYKLFQSPILSFISLSPFKSFTTCLDVKKKL